MDKSSSKRRPQLTVVGQKKKRRKLDRIMSRQCAIILNCLTSHKYSWVFSKPVDPVALNIPDYFSIISEPMDLGTIRTKLDNYMYYGIEEFAADVRLTFSNAITYNPPNSNVHLMAKELNRIFERKWKDLEKKLSREVEHGKCVVGTINKTVIKSCDGELSLLKDFSPLKVSEHNSIQKRRLFAVRWDKAKYPKSAQSARKLIARGMHEGSKDKNGVRISGLAKDRPLTSVSNKCNLCGDISCQCVLLRNSASAYSDLPTKRSEELDGQALGADSLSLRKSDHDPDSDGVVSALESEHACPTQHPISSFDSSTGEVWSASVCDVQLSHSNALRVAKLKRRFAGAILKAQQKTLLGHGEKPDLLNMQQENERLKRFKQAQIKAVEAAMQRKVVEESRQLREKQREAARMALEKVEKSAQSNNSGNFKEREMLCGCTWSYHLERYVVYDGSKPVSPLERLGLFLKKDFDEDENSEEGEIL